MHKPPIKHNPAFLTDEELTRAFVVRHDDLNLIMRVIRENTTDSNQHVLVIGPRGIGKTMLVQRVALEVRQDEELRQKCYPLIFAEESYEVGAAGEFWLESLFHLGRQTRDPKWGRTYEDLKREPVEDRLRERALAQLMDFADRQGKRILLIVENLNMILGNQMAEDHAWKLRHTLMHEPRIMLLATATTRLDLPENMHKAMFELFKSHVLQPLNDEDCQAVWRSVAGQDLGPRRIRAVSILTGGNPRLLVIISHFGARLPFAELMQDMTGLVDDHTDYFKSQLDALPPTERKAYVALADLWDPSTAREVADASRLGVSLTSSLLKRLVGRGAVIEAPRKGRTKRYQVSERMYNIYYLMRRRGAPSERVKAVVQFMVQFYEETELVEVTRRLTEEACHLSREDRQYHYHAFEGIVRTAPPELRSRILQYTRRDFLVAPDRPDSLQKWLAESGVGTVCPCDPRKHPDKRVHDLMRKGSKAAGEGREQEAEEAFREVIGIDAAHPDAWTMLGSIIGKLPDRRDEAEQAHRKATEAAPYYPCAWDFLGRFLSRDSSRRIEAEHAFRKALGSYADCSDAWLGLADLAKSQPGREQDVAQAHREAEEAGVRRTQEYPDHAQSWYMLGQIRHRYTKRFAEAEAAYRKAIELDPNYDRVWELLGNLLYHRLERYTDAEAAYRRAVELGPNNVGALGHLGQLLRDHLGKHEEAEALFKRIIEADSDRVQTAWAWTDLGLLHERRERYAEAEAACRKAIEIDPKYDRVWEQLGNLLYHRLERYTDAEPAYRRALELDPKNISALGHLGQLLRDHLEKYEEAEGLFKRIIELGSGSIHTARAWADLGLLYERLERHAEAEPAYRNAIEIDPKFDWAWEHLGSLLHERLKKYTEAEEAYQMAAELDPKHACPRTQLVQLLLADLKQPDRAFELAQHSLVGIPDSSRLLNGLAWDFFEFGTQQYLPYAEEWARKAVALEADPEFTHTLVCVLARMGKAAEALQFTRRLLEDPKFVGANIDDMVVLFAELVAADCAAEAFTTLRDSSAATALEPVAVAIQMHMGKDVHVAPEIVEIAKDVVKRFNSRIRSRKESMHDVTPNANGQEVIK